MSDTMLLTRDCKRGESHFRLADFTPSGIARLRGALLASVAQGEFEITLDLRHLVSLDVPVLRGLISLLRSVREGGANITLLVAHHDVRRTLAVTALDKVFTVAQRGACSG